ncbi:hypothetical protein FGG90_13065 [Clavibacter tessellarius]|uniref:Uncharacterized protein n=2 Tax=Clavibacter tessellarius TaxID=31965 RepID=A0A225CHY3_9MICO|nr:hypothetical protein [Clavibacter michiganensis]MBT1636968.1 hypothetical protein [Clavibacter michiganensis]OQJ64341.1 hypothetical protein B5P24_03635 [Clavibacter michiganensis subsp. tessellarius]UKF35425.1 hypothetical protein FGG90_13065 [Clavibacter michiganensis subsp. tessellarius]
MSATHRLLGLVNSDDVRVDGVTSPVMATPAAFAAGVVAGGKATAVVVGAAGVGAAVGNAVGGG